MKKEILKEFEVFISKSTNLDKNGSDFVEIANFLSQAIDKTRKETIEIAGDWFTLPPKYRTKERLLQSLKDK